VAGTAPTTADATGSTALGAAISSYTFTFGDGSTTGPQSSPTASHSYTKSGTFTVVVRVTSADGQWDTASANVNVVTDTPPVARLTLLPASDYVPYTLTADGTASSDGQGPIASYRFDCGNGTVIGPQPGSKVTCTYSVAGSFTVRLTVTDGAGHATTTSTVATARPDGPPTARLSAPNGQQRAPVTVALDASGSTDPDKTPIATYRFTCGNGVTIPAQGSPRTTCRYTSSGTYTVTVVVTDTGGKTGTAQDVVKVK
jgi:PKD repeat protein